MLLQARLTGAGRSNPLLRLTATLKKKKKDVCAWVATVSGLNGSLGSVVDTEMCLLWFYDKMCVNPKCELSALHLMLYKLHQQK